MTARGRRAEYSGEGHLLVERALFGEPYESARRCAAEFGGEDFV